MTEQHTSEIPEPVKRRHVINAQDARDQASDQEYSFLASQFVQVEGGEEFEIPHKDLFDPEQQERYDELIDSLRDYDHEPDIFNSEGKLMFKGRLIVPHRKNDKRVIPPYSERLGIVLWGKDGAARYKKGGGNFNLIEIVWAKQDWALQRWRDADPKSNGSNPDVAPASDGD